MSVISSYLKVFRIIFVMCSLYIMGAVFYRWDGFKYYGSFSDFPLGIALAFILWSIVAVIVTIFIWLLFKVVEWSLLLMGRKIRIEHILMFIGVFIFFGALVWKGRWFIRHYVVITQQVKLIILIVVAIISILSTTILRNKAVSWIGIIQERITPLIWLFGVFAILSVSLIAYQVSAYQIWGGEDKGILPEISRTSLSNKKQPNIILVTFDALTIRNMSVYDYHRETTPFIAEWAKNATIFTKTKAESNATSPTTASLMTGKRVWTHQLYAPHGYNVINADTENLPLLLKRNGYYNIALIQNSFASVKTLGISNSIDIAPLVPSFTEPFSIESIIEKQLFRLLGDKFHIYSWIIRDDFIFKLLLRTFPQKIFITEYPPEKVFNRFLEIINNNPPEPFFAWIHVFPPHAPYLPPEPYIGTFDSSPILRTAISQRKIWTRDNIDTKRARYDEFIRYCDKEFEKFIKQLRKYKFFKNTVIILSSDHGQSFEHNYITHGGIHLYESVTNIPLIIKEPAQIEGKIIDDLTEQIDITPTILEFANIPVPLWMEGESLVPIMHGKELQLKQALSMTLEGNRSKHRVMEGTFAIWEGDYKLIHFFKDKKSLLFNLKLDPDELDNLIDKEPGIGQHLLFLIQDNLKKANKKIGK